MTEPTHIRRTRADRVLRAVLPRARRGPVAEVEIAAHHVGGEPIGIRHAMTAVYEPFSVGQAWGPAWDTTWFRVRGVVPAEWKGKTAVLVVRLTAGGGGTGFVAEGMVWKDGEPLQGLSPNHDEVVVADPASGGEHFELWIEAAANPRVDSTVQPPPMHMPDYGGRPTQTLVACHLAVANRVVEALYEDWSLLTELYDQLPGHDARAAQILRALDLAGRRLDREDVIGTAAAAREELEDMLSRPAHASAHRYAAVGNAHIDTAWLWPIRETKRKSARTFATAVTLMDEYPDYRFAASQAQQLAWIRDEYPELFARIRKKVATGQFEVVGSMWVEADCNLPSGESLVRQIVQGKRFFADELGVDTCSLWLPDVFGYPANLPQILALAGVRWFLTQKLSWNQWNRFPHHTFWWEGIDGTRVLSHFPPADTYVGDLSVGQLLHGSRNFAQKALTDRSMYLYGWGDGGGGPTRHMLERSKRAADLESVPRVELMSSSEAFGAIEAEAPLEELPVWVGELYLEMHRGTYTTHAEVKRANRRLELALRDAEVWSLAAAGAASLDYPQAELDRAWQALLLHQFHDIIPGSSIHWVYRDADKDHRALESALEAIVSRSLRSLAAASEPRPSGGSGEPVPTSGSSPGGPVVMVSNPLSWPRREVVDFEGRPVLAEAPPCGWALQALEDAVAPSDQVDCGPRWMSNGLLHVEWDASGAVTSLVHRPSGRQALAPGQRGNVLQVHVDRPNEYDAWDIDAEAYEQGEDMLQAAEVEVVEASPLRARVRIRRQWRSSTIEQVMSLRAGSPCLEIESVVDWRESHILLKAAFPLHVHSPRATYEVQFGHLERPTHSNTSWDEARYEVCGHTWADLSEAGFGVAVLNDSKYGHDVRGNVMRLTLLRSPTWPDPVADQGPHRFTYALMPHIGDPASARVVQAAHGLNSPLRLTSLPGSAPDRGAVPGRAETSGALPERHSLVEVDDPAAVVSAIKRADDGRGAVVRLYESSGGHRTVRVRWSALLAGAGAAACRADLLERPTGQPLERDREGWVTLGLHPFEIVTLRMS